jgi:energy-coupling factor transporter ATP-binding protein EcfA2
LSSSTSLSPGSTSTARRTCFRSSGGSSAQRGRLSLVIVEHDVAAVLAAVGRVVVLDFGERIAVGGPEEIRNDPAVRAAYLGDSEQPQRAQPTHRPADNLLDEVLPDWFDPS